MNKYKGSIDIFKDTDLGNIEKIILPKDECDLLLGKLNEYFLQKDIIFTDYDSEIIEENDMDRFCDLLSVYKQKLPVLFSAALLARDKSKTLMVNL